MSSIGKDTLVKPESEPDVSNDNGCAFPGKAETGRLTDSSATSGDDGYFAFKLPFKLHSSVTPSQGWFGESNTLPIRPRGLLLR